MANLNTRIRGIQIKDADITESQLNASVNASLDLADSALQSIGAGSITETELNVSVNASLDLADSALQSIGAGSITETELNVSVNASLDLADSALQSIPADGVDATKIADDAVGAEHINAGAEVTGYVLTTDAVGGLTWTAKTAGVTEDYIQEAELKFEDESANCNGSAVEFTLDSAPVASSVQVFLNGLLQQVGSGKDYTLASTTVTFATAPASDDILLIHYIAT